MLIYELFFLLKMNMKSEIEGCGNVLKIVLVFNIVNVV